MRLSTDILAQAEFFEGFLNPYWPILVCGAVMIVLLIAMVAIWIWFPKNRSR